MEGEVLTQPPGYQTQPPAGGPSNAPQDSSARPPPDGGVSGDGPSKKKKKKNKGKGAATARKVNPRTHHVKKLDWPPGCEGTKVS